MLKGIDDRLNADMLYVLRAMGHGDMVIVADTNFPAEAIARRTVHGSLLRMENLTAGDATEAIMSVLPLDTAGDDFAARMEIPDQTEGVPPVQAEVQAAIDSAEGSARPMIPVERFAFYDMASRAFAVVQTGERRLYGCFMLRKGVIAPARR